ncbi:unnamed protein product [Heligmosomoides polygyrus]|uniref:Uncharacterized protein n=1 Tax=Heligmosomoides polygyrus TaxID=6339 RepID=A0A183F5W1_HELPZ|nr:unnamed protein product [Heligmosomoides polygyrus]
MSTELLETEIQLSADCHFCRYDYAYENEPKRWIFCLTMEVGSAVVLAVVFVAAVVVVGCRSRRGLGVSPQEEAMELRRIQQGSEHSVLNEH